MTGRILALSLLRAGDALVHIPALAALAREDLELHVLLQAAGGPAAELLAPFARVHVLPVNFTGGDWSPLEPTLASLRALQFDRVVNLTLKRFAAELGERLAPGRVEGFGLPSGQPRLTSPWLRMLNDWGTAASLSVVHYADIYAQAVGGERGAPALRPAESDEAWWSAARAEIPAAAPIVLLQLSTSEKKKTYPRERFAALAAQLAASVPDAALLVLASPAEMAEAFAFCERVGGRARPLVCSLAQAACALREARLLITGDTALVHLGALAGARVLLLSSGSSAFRELGPIGAGHIVLHANYPCSPCRHDNGCVVRQDGFFPCTEAVPPEFAVHVARALLLGQPLPSAPGAMVRVYQSQLDARGLVDYAPLGEPSPADRLAALLRAHMLAPLLGELPAPRTAALSTAQRAALVSMAQVIDALALRARAGESAQPQVQAALQGASEFIVLELAQHLATRFRELRPRGTDPGRIAELQAELARLRQRIDEQLA